MSLLTAGQELAAVDVGEVRRDDMRVVAALLRDPNPIHFDTDATRALGLGDRTINQGALNVSYLVHYVTRAVADSYCLTRLRVRLVANVYEGDWVRCSGTVTSSDHAAQTAEVAVRAAVGERTVLAGTVYLGPRRSPAALQQPAPGHAEARTVP